jgi:hypothetical protein
MNARLVLVSVALGAGMFAGCDKVSEAPRSPPGATTSSPGATTSPPGAPTPTIMNQAPPQSPSTATERKDATSVQGQVDTKEPAQRKDFEKPKP